VRKLTFAVLLGGFLGIFDGLTAWFTPEVRSQIVGIVIGSTIKGVLTGLLVGFFAQKVRSLVWGTVFGLAVGAFFAYLILLMNPGHTLNIMLPGSLVGLIVGYATQQHVTSPEPRASNVERRT
jgi:hypothetical protein